MDRQWAIVGLCAAGLLVRLGMLLYAAGACRAKNAASAITRQLIDLCVTALAFWAAGLAIVSWRGNGWFGLDHRLLVGLGTPQDASAMAFLLVVLIASAVVPTALAERSRFFVTPIASAVLGALVLPLAAFWVWGGWLDAMGMIDAGGAAVHLTAAVFAAVGALVVGPRANKYNRDGSSNVLLGHSVPLALAGVAVIALAWGAYVVAVEMAHGPSVRGPSLLTPLNVLLSAAAAGAAAGAWGFLRYGKVDPMLTCTGLLGGLVAITGAGGTVGTAAAVLIGAVAGVLVPWAAVTLDLRFRLDDPGAVVAIHGVGGLWGSLAAGLLDGGGIGARLAQTGIQALGALAVVILAAIAAIAVFSALRAMGKLRSREADEFDGLDLAEHDVNAYPDFQQTMIKSYHLREA